MLYYLISLPLIGLLVKIIRIININWLLPIVVLLTIIGAIVYEGLKSKRDEFEGTICRLERIIESDREEILSLKQAIEMIEAN